MENFSEEFGLSIDIPETISGILGNIEVQAYLNDKNLTLNFPRIFNNQDLATIYDKIFKSFPTAKAWRTASDKRIIQIATADI